MNKNGQTALKLAFANKKYKAVNALITAGAQPINVDEVDENGMTSLMRVCSEGSYEDVKALLDMGADPGIRDKNGKTAYFYAVENGHIMIADSFVNWGYFFDPTTKDAWTALLMTAVRDGKPEIVSHALHEGADVNNDGGSALFTAIENDKLDIVEILLHHDADITLKNDGGRTALMWAIFMPNITKVLIERGADIDEVDKTGQTALSISADFGSVANIKILLEANASVEIRDNEGKTPLMHAVKQTFRTIGNRYRETVKILIAAGVLIDVQDKYGNTALILAAVEEDNNEIIKILLDAGADPFLKNKKGKTAYDVAHDEKIKDMLRKAMKK